LPGHFAEGSVDLLDLMQDPAVAAATLVGGGGGAVFTIGSVTMEGIVAEPAKGDLGPTLLAGRAPVAPDEVAFGAKTLQALHARLGSAIHLGLLGSTNSATKRIVGEV